MTDSNIHYRKHGVIETLQHQRLLCGWVYIKDESGELIDDVKVVALDSDGNLINACKPSIARADLNKVKEGNQFGFHLDLLASTRLTQLPKVKVIIGEYCQATSFELGYTQSFKKRIERSEVAEELNQIIEEKSELFSSTEINTIKKLLSQDSIQSEIIEKPESLSDVSIPLGTISSDRISIMGKNGYFFLFGGSNSLDKLYKRSGSKTYQSWNQIIESRIKECQRRQIKFAQIIIPEKQSAIPHLYPLSMQAPTENFELLEKSLTPDYRQQVIASFSDKDKPELYYKKTDTHLTSLGAKTVTEKVLVSLGYRLELDTYVNKIQNLAGDLGNKFQGPNFYEAVELFGSTTEPQLLESVDPPNGKHIGITRKWSNPDAPIKLKVIAFANSFFERGTSSTGLSWWFSRIFEEFQFHWNPECDWDIVDKERPDILICQTIERFLPRLPKA